MKWKLTFWCSHRPSIITAFLNDHIGRYTGYLVIFSHGRHCFSSKLYFNTFYVVVSMICYTNNDRWYLSVWYLRFGTLGCFCHLFVSIQHFLEPVWQDACSCWIKRVKPSVGQRKMKFAFSEHSWIQMTYILYKEVKLTCIMMRNIRKWLKMCIALYKSEITSHVYQYRH